MGNRHTRSLEGRRGEENGKGQAPYALQNQGAVILSEAAIPRVEETEPLKGQSAQWAGDGDGIDQPALPWKPMTDQSLWEE